MGTSRSEPQRPRRDLAFRPMLRQRCRPDVVHRAGPRRRCVCKEAEGRKRQNETTRATRDGLARRARHQLVSLFRQLRRDTGRFIYERLSEFAHAVAASATVKLIKWADCRASRWLGMRGLVASSVGQDAVGMAGVDGVGVGMACTP